MEKQDQYFDKAGRLSKEDEMMLAQPNKDMSCAIGMADPTSTMTRATPQLGSTPTKHIFMTEEQNMKKIEMPKPFQL